MEPDSALAAAEQRYNTLLHKYDILSSKYTLLEEKFSKSQLEDEEDEDPCQEFVRKVGLVTQPLKKHTKQEADLFGQIELNMILLAEDCRDLNEKRDTALEILPRIRSACQQFNAAKDATVISARKCITELPKLRELVRLYKEGSKEWVEQYEDLLVSGIINELEDLEDHLFNPDLPVQVHAVAVGGFPSEAATAKVEWDKVKPEISKEIYRKAYEIDKLVKEVLVQVEDAIRDASEIVARAFVAEARTYDFEEMMKCVEYKDLAQKYEEALKKSKVDAEAIKKLQETIVSLDGDAQNSKDEIARLESELRETRLTLLLTQEYKELIKKLESAKEKPSEEAATIKKLEEENALLKESAKEKLRDEAATIKKLTEENALLKESTKEKLREEAATIKKLTEDNASLNESVQQLQYMVSRTCVPAPTGQGQNPEAPSEECGPRVKKRKFLDAASDHSKYHS